MTREEAKVILEDNKPSIIFEDEELQKRSADVCEALDKAIDALDIINQIREKLFKHAEYILIDKRLIEEIIERGGK